MGVIMIDYFKEVSDVIEKTLSNIDEEIFNKLISEAESTIKKGNKIIVSGLGKNVPICDKFVGTMLSMGLNANFLHTNSAVHGDLGMVKEGDLVIILTKSGETIESICLTKHLEKKKANIWLLTFNESSTLTKRINNSVVLKMTHEGDLWNIVPNNSTTLNLIFLQAVAMSVAKKMGVTLEDFKINHPGGNIGEVLK